MYPRVQFWAHCRIYKFILRAYVWCKNLRLLQCVFSFTHLWGLLHCSSPSFNTILGIFWSLSFFKNANMKVTGGPLGNSEDGWKGLKGEQTPINRNVTKIIWAILIIYYFPWSCFHTNASSCLLHQVQKTKAPCERVLIVFPLNLKISSGFISWQVR